MGVLHVPSLYIQLVPPTDREMTGTLGHLSGSNEQIQTQKATKAKRVSSREENRGQRWVLMVFIPTQYTEGPRCFRAFKLSSNESYQRKVVSILLTWQ